MHGDLCSSIEFSSMLCASFRIIVLMVSYFMIHDSSAEPKNYCSQASKQWGLIGLKCSGHFSISKHQYPQKIVVDSVGLMAYLHGSTFFLNFLLFWYIK